MSNIEQEAAAAAGKYLDETIRSGIGYPVWMAAGFEKGYLAHAAKSGDEVERLRAALEKIREVSEGWYGEPSDSIEAIVNEALSH